jgi:uncharacterized pyridoxamine 5'-phosphate oxidase family protein
MPEKKEEVRSRILRFLQQNKTAVIATLSAQGEPQAATISYIVDEQFDIYFIARKGSRKFINLSTHQNLGLVVGTDPKVPAMAEIQGVAHPVENPNPFVADYFAEALASEDPEWWPLYKSRSMDFVFYRVEIQWMRWLDLATSGDFHVFRGDFYEIES